MHGRPGDEQGAMWAIGESVSRQHKDMAQLCRRVIRGRAQHKINLCIKSANVLRHGGVDPGRATGGLGDAPFGAPQVPWPSDTRRAKQGSIIFDCQRKVSGNLKFSLFLNKLQKRIK